MKTWLKENWFKAAIIVILIILLCGFGYFSILRPILVKKHCAIIAYRGTGFYNLGKVITGDEQDELYKVCLRKYGL